MISLSRLNKLIFLIIIFTALNFNFSFAEDKPEDIWEAKDEKQESNQNEIDEQQEIDRSERTVIGIFDPEENNFSLNMWSESDGEDIKNILKRINKLKLSKLSEDLLFQVLFTSMERIGLSIVISCC